MKDLQKYETGALVFGDWRITEEIGSGSYGTVYKIEKTEYGITADAALKVIRIPKNQSEIRDILGDGMDEKSMTSYFQGMVDSLVREIAVMSNLKSHPNIVTYENHKVMSHPGTVGWDILIQMELLTPLRDYQAKCPMTEAEVRRLGLDVCSALVFCQKKALIHRDIKPQNIFVSEVGQFKLGDFGVARTMDKTVGSLSKQGTEDYMAPEVYRGQKYGPNVDIYSLGLVLYRLMNNNRLPFMPPAPQPLGFGDRLNALTDRIGGEKPVMPPCNASPEFARIILKACAHDPKDRYQTAAEMLEDLKALDRETWGEKPLAAPEPGREEPEEKREEEEEPGTIGPFGKREEPKTEAEEKEGKTLGPFSKPLPQEETEEPKEEPAPKKKRRVLPLLIGAAAVCVAAAAAFAIFRSGGEKASQPQEVSQPQEELEALEEMQAVITWGPGLDEYTDEEGYQNVYEYDEQGNLTYRRIGYADGETLFEVRYTVDGAGNSVMTWYRCYTYSGVWNSITGSGTEYAGCWEETYDLEGHRIEYRSYYANGNLELVNVFDTNENVIAIEGYNEDGTKNSSSTDTYGDDGKLVKSETYRYNADGTRKEYSVMYYDDADGNLSKMEDEYYGDDERLTRRVEYTYQPDGTEVWAWDYNEDGTLNQMQREWYDADGNRTEAEFYNGDETLNCRWEMTYDASGMPTESVKYTADGTLDCRTEYSYDDEGNRTETYYRGDGTLDEERTYNANFHQTGGKYYNADGSLNYSTETIYDGDKVLESMRYDSEGVLQYHWVYSYDSYGNEIGHDCWNGDGVMVARTVYTYDVGGNRIKIENYEYNAADGSLKSWTETTYDEDGKATTVTHDPDE